MIPISEGPGTGNKRSRDEDFIVDVKPQPGDRVHDDHGDQCIITPAGAAHNFGPASARDQVVFTCERPGGDTHGSMIATKSVVNKWTQCIRDQHKVKNVIVLLEEKELQAYDMPGLMASYQEAGMTAHHVAYSSPNSYQKIMEILSQAEASGERAVAHCTHGMGRSGRVAAGWLVQRYSLSPEQAVEEALEAARTHQVERMGAPQQLKTWMQK